jgi:copper chaperone CopZ
MSVAQSMTVRIDGMHCDGCATKIREAVQRLDGVRKIEVDRSRARADVTVDDEIDAKSISRSIVDAIRGAGDYSASLVDEDGRGASEEPSDAAGAPRDADAEPGESIYPLILIVGYIAGTVILVAWATGDWSAGALMRHFMAGFFLVFSFFKLLDLRGFVSAYRDYDLVAKALPAWAWIYPFVELALGVGYLLDLLPIVTNLVTFAVMTVGAVGVLKALLNRRRIRCACLGTALNLPMTTVSLVEDLLMAAMAAAMLVMLLW